MEQLSCPFKTSRDLGVRAAPWSAVAAATALLVLALAPFPYEPQADGGSCCYRSPQGGGAASKMCHGHPGHAGARAGRPWHGFGCGYAAVCLCGESILLGAGILNFWLKKQESTGLQRSVRIVRGATLLPI